MDSTTVFSLRVNITLNGRYIIKSVLGQGGFGITYLAQDKLFQKAVAVKEFFPYGLVVRDHNSSQVTISGEADVRELFETEKNKFLKEAQVMVKFRKDDGITEVIDFFEANNTAYIVMEYIDGITLREYVRKYGAVQPQKIVSEWMQPLMKSLSKMHQAGMIHRDISPDNIMILKDGTVKLMDFGASRCFENIGSKGLTTIVKRCYSPIEQYQRESIQGPYTDIYALCATMYMCITKANPPASIERVMLDSLRAPSQYGISIPINIEKVLLKGMEVFPQNRYQTIDEMYEELYGSVEETPEYDLSTYLSQRLKNGTVVNGRYVIDYSIGHNDFMMYYHARDIQTGENIILKEVFIRNHADRDAGQYDYVISYSNDELVEAVKRKVWEDCQYIQKVEKHPGFVAVLDCFVANNTVYIVLEDYEGITLETYLKGNTYQSDFVKVITSCQAEGIQHMNMNELLSRMWPLMEGLSKFHEAGWIFEDITPNNIIIASDGYMKLVPIEENSITFRQTICKFQPDSAWRPPKGYTPWELYEQGHQKRWYTDVYAIAAVIYFCITGNVPPDALERKRNREEILIPPYRYGVAITVPQEQAILRAMSVEREYRYQTMGEFYQALYRQ